MVAPVVQGLGQMQHQTDPPTMTPGKFLSPAQLQILMLPKVGKRVKEVAAAAKPFLSGPLWVALLVGQTLLHIKCFIVQMKLSQDICVPKSCNNKQTGLCLLDVYLLSLM